MGFLFFFFNESEIIIQSRILMKKYQIQDSEKSCDSDNNNRPSWSQDTANATKAMNWSDTERINLTKQQRPAR